MFTDTMCEEAKLISLHRISDAHYIHYSFKSKNICKDYWDQYSVLQITKEYYIFLELFLWWLDIVFRASIGSFANTVNIEEVSSLLPEYKATFWIHLSYQLS